MMFQGRSLAFEPMARKIDDQKTSKVLSRECDAKTGRKQQTCLRFSNVPCISCNRRGTLDSVWFWKLSRMLNPNTYKC